MKNKQEFPTINQTQFMNEEPLLESPTDVVVEDTSTPSKKENFFKTKTGRIISLVGGAFILLLIFIIFMAKNNRSTTQLTTDEIIVEEAREVNPLQEKINDLQDQLDEADPNKSSLAFPPVDLEIEITEK